MGCTRYWHWFCVQLVCVAHSSLTAGTLEIGGFDDRLRSLFLGDYSRLREIEEGVLPGALQHVWRPGAALNCSHIAPRLPGAATCLDGAYYGAEHLARIGNGRRGARSAAAVNGICDEDYDTAKCAWDGGDCWGARHT